MSQVILTINGGSSSIKFALYRTGHPPRRMLAGQIERIGQNGTTLIAPSATGTIEKHAFIASNHDQAAQQLVAWLRQRLGDEKVIGIGHRVVHGGPNLLEYQLITPQVIDELKKVIPLDLAHLPQEISLIETLTREFSAVPQIACFDTAFFRDLPLMSQLLPIPRRYKSAGIRRFGFHGLSYTYLLDELRRLDASRADGRVIFAHLGSGASMAAVQNGQPIDTTMSFTPTAGLVMGTRPGDIDPGLLIYLMRAENRSLDEWDQFINRDCGLIGISQISSDMRDLIAKRDTDPRAKEAVAIFCYQARKFIGAYAAAMGGLDTLIFSGGIGEHSREVRAEICANLEFLGVHFDAEKNNQSAPIISSENSRVSVRIIPTDEELVIAQTVSALLNLAN